MCIKLCQLYVCTRVHILIVMSDRNTQISHLCVCLRVVRMCVCVRECVCVCVCAVCRSLQLESSTQVIKSVTIDQYLPNIKGTGSRQRSHTALGVCICMCVSVCTCACA